MDVLRRCSLPKILTVPPATGNMKFPLLCCVNTSFALRLLARSSDASISSNSSMSADHNVSFPDFHRAQCITEKYTWQDFRAELMQSRQVFGRNRVIFDHCSERNYWSFVWFAESPFIRCFPIRQEIFATVRQKSFL